MNNIDYFIFGFALPISAPKINNYCYYIVLEEAITSDAVFQDLSNDEIETLFKSYSFKLGHRALLRSVRVGTVLNAFIIVYIFLLYGLVDNSMV